MHLSREDQAGTDSPCHAIRTTKDFMPSIYAARTTSELNFCLRSKHRSKQQLTHPGRSSPPDFQDVVDIVDHHEVFKPPEKAEAYKNTMKQVTECDMLMTGIANEIDGRRG